MFLYRHGHGEETALRPEELDTTVIALRELGMSYNESIKVIAKVTKETKTLKSLIGKPTGRDKSSWLIKLGLSLIVFPIPTFGIKKSLGATLIAAGLIQKKIKPMQIADVYSNFQKVSKELRKLNREL